MLFTSASGERVLVLPGRADLVMIKAIINPRKAPAYFAVGRRLWSNPKETGSSFVSERCASARCGSVIG